MPIYQNNCSSNVINVPVAGRIFITPLAERDLHCQTLCVTLLRIVTLLWSFPASTSVCLSVKIHGLTRSWKRNAKIWSESFKNRSVTSSLGAPIRFGGHGRTRMNQLGPNPQKPRKPCTNSEKRKLRHRT